MPFKFKKFPTILVITLGLLTVGLIFISISSLSESKASFGDQYFYLRRQGIWTVFGLVGLFIFSKLNLNSLKKFLFPAYIASIIFLILVLIPHIGNSVLGARRWISFGFINFQPSELYKFIAIPYFALLFTDPDKRNLKTLAINLLGPLLLIILEPNMSTTVLITSIILSMYYLAGGPLKSLAVVSLVGVLASILLIVTSPYRQARLQSLLNPDQNTSGQSYHTNQIIISLASGGLFGKGLGNSSQKYQYLPQLTTDSILAVIGEETGFVGLSIIVFLYINLIISIFRIAKTSDDLFYQLIASGVGCWIAYQSLINLSAIAAIIPLTGVPLPFISYGGSSIATLLSAVGIVVNLDNLNNKVTINHVKRK